jgi:hypothetical protein
VSSGREWGMLNDNHQKGYSTMVFHWQMRDYNHQQGFCQSMRGYDFKLSNYKSNETMFLYCVGGVWYRILIITINNHQ